MCLSATFGLTGWLQDTQKICRSVSSLSPSFTFVKDIKEASNVRSARERRWEEWGRGAPPRPAGRPAAWPWRWCPPVRGSVSPSRSGAAGRSAAPAGCAPAASCRAPRRCRDSAATAGCAEEGSHRSGCGKHSCVGAGPGSVLVGDD